MSGAPQADRSNVTWESSRRAQLRAALALSVRDRLLAMEGLGELSEKLAIMHRMAAPPPSQAAIGKITESDTI